MTESLKTRYWAAGMTIPATAALATAIKVCTANPSDGFWVTVGGVALGGALLTLGALLATVLFGPEDDEEIARTAPGEEVDPADWWKAGRQSTDDADGD